MSFTKIPILFQQLFMKKLMISSKSFVSLMSTINFSSLRLDHFIQLLNTSSVIISLQDPHLLKCTGNLSTTSWKMKLVDDRREDRQ